MLWLSGIVVDQMFTSGGVDVHHHCVNVFIHMLNFHSWSQPQNYFPQPASLPMVDIHTYSSSLIFATASADLFFLLSSPEGLRTKL